MGNQSSLTTQSVAVPFFAGIVGGYLLAQWLNRMHTSASFFGGGQVQSSDASAGGGLYRQNEPAPSMPSSHLGATEDQMNRSMARPAANSAQSGDVSVAGAAYELDPGGITPG